MLHDWLNQPGYLSLFFVSFLASTLLPLGSEWLLVMMLAGGYDPVPTVAVATAGNYLGAVLTYLIGIWGGNWLIEKVLRVSPPQQERARQLLSPFRCLLAALFLAAGGRGSALSGGWDAEDQFRAVFAAGRSRQACPLCGYGGDYVSRRLIERHTGMEELQTDTSQSAQQRYKGYDRIMGNISWLLIALVALDMKLSPTEGASMVFLAVLLIMLFVYNLNARYGVFSRRYGAMKIFIDLMVFLSFIVAVCWYTGKITSPFMSLIYLILMATSLTQGRRVTYFMAALAVTSYILLASADFRELNYYLTHIFELFPFMLIAHLGATLAGESEAARSEVERLSLTDDVTGLNNMRNFFLLSDIQEKLAIRHVRPFAICMIDADNLKKVNDQYGHLAGTKLIQQVAGMITANVRSSDICARYGGDEFVIMFNETGKQDVIGAVERIVHGMATTPFDFEGQSITTTLSAGVAGYPEDGGDVRTIMVNADEAMYVTKRSGKNRLTVYSGTMYEDSFGRQAGGTHD